jgi:hypothetical protein
VEDVHSIIDKLMVNKVKIQSAIINVDFVKEQRSNEVYDEIPVRLLLDDLDEEDLDYDHDD